MPDYRARYAGASLAGLSWDENQEKAIDRVAAAGKVTNIALWDTAYGLSHAGLAKLERDLTHVLEQRYKGEQQCAKIANQAVLEWVFGACPRCQGSGEVLHSNKIVVCPECAGAKLHRYSDEERSRMMQLSYAKVRQHLRHKLTWALGWLGHLDRRTNIEFNVELGE